MNTPENIQPGVLRAMREWVADCVWADVEDVSDLSDAQIINGVRRHFDGGIPAFLQTMEVAA